MNSPVMMMTSLVLSGSSENLRSLMTSRTTQYPMAPRKMRAAVTPSTRSSLWNADMLLVSGRMTKPALLNPDTAWNRDCHTASAGS